MHWSGNAFSWDVFRVLFVKLFKIWVFEALAISRSSKQLVIENRCFDNVSRNARPHGYWLFNWSIHSVSIRTHSNPYTPLILFYLVLLIHLAGNLGNPMMTNFMSQLISNQLMHFNRKISLTMACRRYSTATLQKSPINLASYTDTAVSSKLT